MESVVLSYGDDILHLNIEAIQVRITLLGLGIRGSEIGGILLTLDRLAIDIIGDCWTLDESTSRIVETEVIGSLCEVLEMEGELHPLLSLGSLDFTTLTAFDSLTDTFEVFKVDTDTIGSFCVLFESGSFELGGWLGFRLEGDGDVLAREIGDDGEDLSWVHMYYLRLRM
jgi:hypothetical protein